jgi:hypothetical protein
MGKYTHHGDIEALLGSDICSIFTNFRASWTNKSVNSITENI